MSFRTDGKVFPSEVKTGFEVCFMSSPEVVSPIEKSIISSKEFCFAKLRTPLGLKKTAA